MWVKKFSTCSSFGVLCVSAANDVGDVQSMYARKRPQTTLWLKCHHHIALTSNFAFGVFFSLTFVSRSSHVHLTSFISGSASHSCRSVGCHIASALINESLSSSHAPTEWSCFQGSATLARRKYSWHKWTAGELTFQFQVKETLAGGKRTKTSVPQWFLANLPWRLVLCGHARLSWILAWTYVQYARAEGGHFHESKMLSWSVTCCENNKQNHVGTRTRSRLF